MSTPEPPDLNTKHDGVSEPLNHGTKPDAVSEPPTTDTKPKGIPQSRLLKLKEEFGKDHKYHEDRGRVLIDLLKEVNAKAGARKPDGLIKMISEAFETIDEAVTGLDSALKVLGIYQDMNSHEYTGSEKWLESWLNEQQKKFELLKSTVVAETKAVGSTFEEWKKFEEQAAQDAQDAKRPT